MHAFFRTPLAALGRRALSAAATPPPPKYRFARNTTFPPGTREPANARLLVGKGIMAHVNKTIPSQQGRILMDTLFSKKHPDRLLPGSVITLHLTHHPTLFSGVIIAIRRRGGDTSFTLRNVVNRVGTELTFYIGSPHLKKIDIIQRAGLQGGGLGRRSRRAKYYFLRDSPEKMSQISAGIAR